MSTSHLRVLLAGFEATAILQLQEMLDSDPGTIRTCDLLDLPSDIDDYDVVLVGESRDGSSPATTLVSIRATSATLPLIRITATYDQDLDRATIASGADDYLSLDELTPRLLDRAVNHAVERASFRSMLRQSNSESERYKLLIEKGLDLITIVGSDGAINFESPSIQSLLGYTPEELMGRSILELIHPDDHLAVIRIVEDSILTPGLIRRVTLRYLHADGSVRFLESIGTNLIENPLINGYIVNSRDVTEWIAMEHALTDANERLETRVAERTAEIVTMMRKLEDATATLKRFIADASHDLRTPLTVIRAELDLLLRQKLEPEVYLVLRRLISQTKRLDSIFTDLLLLATLEIDESPVDIVRFDEVMLECASQLAFAADARKISWRVECDEPVEFECRQMSIRRMLTNLMDNAVKYSHDGGVISLELHLLPSAPVGIGVARQARSIEFIIKDSGAGITEQDLPHVFDRFYRGDLTRNTPGTGLGMSIVKAAADAHGGSVTVDSVAGRGTTVTVRLPYLEAASGAAPGFLHLLHQA